MKRTGGPAAWGLIVLIISRMFEQGRLLEGIWFWTQYDSYGREQDMQMVFGSDIFIDRHADPMVVFQFGTRERGLSVKTGSNQSVELDCPLLSRVIASLRVHYMTRRLCSLSHRRTCGSFGRTVCLLSR